MAAINITVANKYNGFVKGCPQLDPGTEALIAQSRVFGEGFRCAPSLPTPFVLQCLGQIPVIKGDHRFNIVRQQFVDQIAVKLHAWFIDFATATRQ